MKMILMGLALLALMNGCQASESAHSATPVSSTGGSRGTGAGETSTWRARDANELFNVDHVPLFEFNLPVGDWQWLQDNAIQEQYVQAEATYDGRPAGTIGLRFKGAYGSLYTCFDRSSGALLCPKLSFKVNFGKYDSTNRFFRLKVVNLHSMVRDPTKLHERLGYDLFQLSDIEAPRSTWANVIVNGQSYGLFSLVEEIDSRFTADRWPSDADGNLYKEAWPASTDLSYYAHRLETNEDTANNEDIVAFANDLLQARPDQLNQTLGSWMDLDYLYRYMAVDDAVMDCDGPTAFYCATIEGPVYGNHNYFLYQSEQRKPFWLVTWDMTRALTACPAFGLVPHWSIQPAECDQNYQVWDGGWVKAAGCDRVFQALAQDWPRYQAAVDNLLAGAFDTATVLGKIDTWSQFIRDAVVADPTADGEADWRAAVSDLKSKIPILRERLTRLRDGTTIAPLTLSLARINDFESASPVEAMFGVQLDASVHTYATQQLNTIHALDGQQDLRLDFVYRDPSQLPGEGSQQWIYLMLPLGGGFHDLSAVSHLRMLLLSDQQRTVRIDLESDRYQAAGKRIRFGWEVPVDDAVTPVDLVLDKATLPAWATGTGDVLAEVRQHVNGVVISPAVVGANDAGYLGSGNSDGGYLRIDNIVFASP